MRSRFRLAILECDTPLPNTKEQYGGYGGVFKALINSGAEAEGYKDAAEVLDIHAYNVEQYPGEYPDLSEIDGLLLTGSRHDSFADATWILKLVEYTTQALAQERLRLIGVCFGHQIIARAMGAGVGRNPEGWEAAVNDVQLSKLGKDIFRLDSLRIHQMHRDIAFACPEGVEPLGSSPVCQVQAFYQPKHVLTVQGHPEFNNTIMKEILDTRHKTGIFDDDAYKQHIKKVDLPHDGIAIGASFVRFLLEQ